MAAAGFNTAFLALACAGCTSIAADHRTFEGTTWRATEVNGRGLAAAERLTLDFGPYYSSTTGSCNTKRSHYRVAGRMLVFEGGMTTERGCEAAQMDFDERAFAILSGPTRMRWSSGKRVTLVNGTGSIELEFVR